MSIFRSPSGDVVDFDDDSADPHYMMTHTPILSFFFKLEATAAAKSAGSTLFWSVLCANTPFSHTRRSNTLLAVDARNTAAVQAAYGRLCNYHAFRLAGGIESVCHS